jgi:hypothetical protein
MAFENQQDSHFSGGVKQALSPSLCLKTGCQLSFTIHHTASMLAAIPALAAAVTCQLNFDDQPHSKPQ